MIELLLCKACLAILNEHFRALHFKIQYKLMVYPMNCWKDFESNSNRDYDFLLNRFQNDPFQVECLN